MNIKTCIKNFCGRVRAVAFGITAGQGTYIGKNCDFKGQKKISLQDFVVIRPNVQIWSGGGTVKIGNSSEIGERCRISIANSLEIGKKCCFHLMCILLIAIMNIVMSMFR